MKTTEIKIIKKDLNKSWSKQKTKGLARLHAAYRFFTAVDDEGEDDLGNIIEFVFNESEAQAIRDCYVKDNFIVDSDYFGGMDANSEINRAAKRDRER